MPNLQGFDANNVEPVPSFDPIPAGQYLAMIVASEEKTSQKGFRYVSLEFEIVDGQYQGRKLWVNLNLYHPDAEAVKFARAELAAICKAIGVLKPQDSVQLHNLPMLITVKCANRKDTGELQNRIKNYISKSAAAQGVPHGSVQGVPPQAAPQGMPPGQVQGQPQAPAAASTPPWRKQQ